MWFICDKGVAILILLQKIHHLQYLQMHFQCACTSNFTDNNKRTLRHHTHTHKLNYLRTWNAILPNSGLNINASNCNNDNTHTQTCKHRQTGSSHCSSFVYTLTFSQHLSYVLYTFGKRGPFSNWGPYCSFCYKSPVWMPKQTHTHPHCTHGTCGVLHCLLFCDQTRPNLRISLVGYHCAIEFPCGVLLFYCCKYPTTYGVRVQTCKHRQTGSSHCSSFVYTLTFSQHLSYVLYTFGKRGPFSNWGPYFCYKSPVWMPKQTHTHTACPRIPCKDSPFFFSSVRPSVHVFLMAL